MRWAGAALAAGAILSLVAGCSSPLRDRAEPVRDAGVWEWGFNEWNPRMERAGDICEVEFPREIIALSAGTNHVLALDKYVLATEAEGNVWVWGVNYFGALGITGAGIAIYPVRLSEPQTARMVAAGCTHSLALASDGTVWAWGANDCGQLGDGTTTDQSLPARIEGLTDVVFIEAGGFSSFAIRSDGTLWAWGDNDTGQLGLGDTQDGLKPVLVAGIEGARCVATGGWSRTGHTLAALVDGTVWAWGDGSSGQLSLSHRPSPEVCAASGRRGEA